MKIIALCLFLTLGSFAAEPEIQKVFKFFVDENNGKKTWTASAFYISETQLLTAAHTLRHGTIDPRIMMNGKLVQARIVKIDFENDVALLESVKNADHFILASNGKVRLIGFVADKKEISINIGFQKKIEASANCFKGMSGCPLVNDSNVVIGMGIQRDGDNHPCFAVPSDTLLRFLEK